MGTADHHMEQLMSMNQSKGEQAELIWILEVPIEIDSACIPNHVVLKDFYYLLSHLYVELHPVLPIAFLHNM